MPAPGCARPVRWPDGPATSRRRTTPPGPRRTTRPRPGDGPAAGPAGRSPAGRGPVRARARPAARPGGRLAAAGRAGRPGCAGADRWRWSTGRRCAWHARPHRATRGRPPSRSRRGRARARRRGTRPTRPPRRSACRPHPPTSAAGRTARRRRCAARSARTTRSRAGPRSGREVWADVMADVMSGESSANPGSAAPNDVPPNGDPGRCHGSPPVWPVTSSAGQATVATTPSRWSISGRSSRIPPVERRAIRSAIRDVAPVPARDPPRASVQPRPATTTSTSSAPSGASRASTSTRAPGDAAAASSTSSATRCRSSTAAVLASVADGAAVTETRDGSSASPTASPSTAGTVCGAPRCTPGIRPAQQQERLAVAAQPAADVAQLGDPRAVVGELGEQGDAVEQRLLAVDPVLQAAGQVGRGPVVAERVGPVAEHRAGRRVGPRRGTGGETRPRIPPARPSWARERTSCHSRSSSRTGRCARAAPAPDPLTRTGRSSCGRHTTGRPARRSKGAGRRPDGGPPRRPSG